MRPHTIDAAERELMATTIRGLAEELDGTELAQALDAFGFADLLAEAPRDAVSALFTALGGAGSMSTSLQDVLLRPLAEHLPPRRRHTTLSYPASAPIWSARLTANCWRCAAWSSERGRC